MFTLLYVTFWSIYFIQQREEISKRNKAQFLGLFGSFPKVRVADMSPYPSMNSVKESYISSLH